MDLAGRKGTVTHEDIRIGRWPVQGVERRLRSLELMIEGWRNPNIKFYEKKCVDIAPGEVRLGEGRHTKNPLRKATADDIGNLKAGIDNCHKLLEDLEETPPEGRREKLWKIDRVIQVLNNIEDSITVQRPQQVAMESAGKGGKARATKVRADNSTRDKRIMELREEGKNNEEIARALDPENLSAIK